MLPTGLPAPDRASADHSARVAQHLHAAIAQHGGWLAFERWMDLALYAPGLGYYAAGRAKIAANDPGAGDFVTAPELSPLFGQTLAGPIAQVLEATGTAHILEFGAGTGALADALITELDALGLPVTYDILEVSADLRARQQVRLAHHSARVRWRDTLPSSFAGCVLANEMLDAMPVRLFHWDHDGVLSERGVASHGNAFVWADRRADADLTKTVTARMAATVPQPTDYTSEINPRAEAWVRGMGDWLSRGAAFLIDYGFPRREYYHPQRASGTLMCHYRHHAHADPLVLPGLQDLTAHVDFTAMADAALAGGLTVAGYTSQARFLLEAGLPARLTAAMQTTTDPQALARLTGPVQKLLSEAEMGELFKVLVLSKNLAPPSRRCNAATDARGCSASGRKRIDPLPKACKISAFAVNPGC